MKDLDELVSGVLFRSKTLRTKSFYLKPQLYVWAAVAYGGAAVAYGGAAVRMYDLGVRAAV